MFLVQNILVSEQILQEEFVCNLSKCKGACCWEGDYGAPLEDDEKTLLESSLEELRPFMLEESYWHVMKMGATDYYEEPAFNGTRLMPNGACAFMTIDENGVAQCGIENAHKAGATQMAKPISCHLYPIRVKKNPVLDFEALNYDKWDICSAACSLGSSLKIPLYIFLKDAIIRRYGEAFWNELDEVAKDLKSKGDS